MFAAARSSFILPLLVCLACGQAPASMSSQGDTTTGDGDGDITTGDGDGDGDHWCDICIHPSDGANCEAAFDLDQHVLFHPNFATDEYTIAIDETCTVLTVSPSLLELDCETIDPQIALDLVEPWTPNLAIDETVRLLADGGQVDATGRWAVDWRVDRADERLALAGRHRLAAFDELGLGAIELIVESGVCVPSSCANDSSVWEQVAMTFTFEGEQATLFKGGHAIVGNREIWIADAKHLACDVADVFGSVDVFVSAVD